MIRRWALWAVWLAVAAALAFFENGLGTRTLLFWSLLLPAIVRFRASAASPHHRAAEQPDTRPLPETEQASAPDGVRAYVPGNPIRRIHWKLSAKTDRLLIREDSPSEDSMNTEAPFAAVSGTVRSGKADGRPVWLIRLLPSMAAALLLLAILIPTARGGLLMLLNGLQERSEAVNAYRYTRFAVPAGQTPQLAGGLLIAAGALLAAWLFLSCSRLLAFCMAAGVAAAEIFLGLTLPLWAQVPLLGVLALMLLPRPLPLKRAGIAAAGLLALLAVLALLWPGVDAPIEEASEQVRDLFARATGEAEIAETAAPEELTETRHVNTRSLLPGEEEAQAGKTYRLVTVEEQQISRPQWVDLVRILLLSLLALAVLVLPFVPPALLLRRRKRAAAEREAFDSADCAAAICAMFRQIGRWLRSTGHDAGNCLFREWPDSLAGSLPDSYVSRFAACVPLFEEAYYSGHAMAEAQREAVRSLLEETEEMLYRRADWKKRLRLRYVECLWNG